MGRQVPHRVTRTALLHDTRTLIGMTQQISLSLQQITLRVMALERVLRGRGLVTDEDMQAAYVAMVQEQAEAGKTDSTEKNAD